MDFSLVQVGILNKDFLKMSKNKQRERGLYMDVIYEEKHKHLSEKLEVHDRRLNNHSERIDKLEQYQSKSEVEIRNLCEQIKSLVSTIKWSMGLLITSLVGFFIWYIQTL